MFLIDIMLKIDRRTISHNQIRWADSCRRDSTLVSFGCSPLMSKLWPRIQGYDGQARPSQAKSGQAKPGQARPSQARPGQARPSPAPDRAPSQPAIRFRTSTTRSPGGGVCANRINRSTLGMDLYKRGGERKMDVHNTRRKKDLYRRDGLL